MFDLKQVCEQLPTSVHVLIWIAVLVWERGLGRTKFGSTLGLLVDAPIKRLLNALDARKIQQPPSAGGPS